MRISNQYKMIVFILAMAATTLAFAQAGAGAVGEATIGGIAKGVADSFGSLGRMLVATSYLLGFGFLLFGVLKFKQHKDNPTQVTLGLPIVMTLIGGMLVFVGGFIAPLGETFGVSKEEAGGFTGKGVQNIPGGGPNL